VARPRGNNRKRRMLLVIRSCMLRTGFCPEGEKTSTVPQT
jgi:hypothetical protein